MTGAWSVLRSTWATSSLPAGGTLSVAEIAHQCCRSLFIIKLKTGNDIMSWTFRGGKKANMHLASLVVSTCCYRRLNQLYSVFYPRKVSRTWRRWSAEQNKQVDLSIWLEQSGNFPLFEYLQSSGIYMCRGQIFPKRLRRCVGRSYLGEMPLSDDTHFHYTLLLSLTLTGSCWC